MNENTKRIIDWLTLPFLCLPAAVIWFGYINNTHPSKIWIAVLMFDTPFAAAALIWLSWRFLPWGERTKRIIDWLTLIPLGFWPATAVWAHYTHQHGRPPVIWLTLMFINLPLLVASMIWLILRMDKIKIVHWFIYNIVMRRTFRMLLFALFCLDVVFFLIKLLLINGPWR